MKIKILISAGALICVTAALPAIEQFAYATAKVTARIVDEQANPISEAVVTYFFGGAHSTNAIVKTEVKTGSDGNAVGEGYSGGSYGVSVTKAGYYPSGLNAPPLVNIIDGRWQPWNPTAVTVLRPIVKPVPLYAKRVQTQIPALDQPCGYDLEKGDWVSPYGNGQTPDLTFKVKRDYKDWFNFTVEAEVKFAQPNDGLLRMKSPLYARISSFRWERAAPETGYKAPQEIRFVNHDPRSGQVPELTFDTTKDREQGYFFRVRTIEQNGQIIAANYGKITGDIAIDPRDTKTCMILFTYYLNPTSLDRNLEWDTTKNLLPGLKYEEAPREP